MKMMRSSLWGGPGHELAGGQTMEKPSELPVNETPRRSWAGGVVSDYHQFSMDLSLPRPIPA